jgi:hypothetical protein
MWWRRAALALNGMVAISDQKGSSFYTTQPAALVFGSVQQPSALLDLFASHIWIAMISIIS